MTRLYYPLSDYLKEKFGEKVYKVTIDAGLTCPNRDGTKGYGGCAYCEPETLKPKDYDKGMGAGARLAAGMEKVRRRHKANKFIAYFQINTNTHADVEYLRRIYSEALLPGDVVGMAVSTRPDCLGDGVLSLLKELKDKKHLWVELGLQSANDGTLRSINRGHTADDFKDAARRAKSSGIDVCAHVILGLPGEERADALNTAKFLSTVPVWGVKFHQLEVVKGTMLEEMHKKSAVKLLSLEEYANLVVECLELLAPDAVVHRLSGDVPSKYLIAPKWGANKFEIKDRILRLMSEKKTRQGAKFKS